MDENVIIRATNISRLYRIGFEKYVKAIKNIDLVIERGEFISIMGPSGAGKSTLLNCISTIDLPTKGKVEIEGQNIKMMSTHKLNSFRYNCLGFIFQSFHLLDKLTVYDNLALPLSMHKVPYLEFKKRIDAVANQLDISSILNKLPKECSGGQQQRVSIARALVTLPDLIIADEPTGNLDSKNSHELLMILDNLNRSGKTIVMVSHNSMVASYSKRVIYIKDGKIENEIMKGTKTRKKFYEEIVQLNAEQSVKEIDE